MFVLHVIDAWTAGCHGGEQRGLPLEFVNEGLHRAEIRLRFAAKGIGIPLLLWTQAEFRTAFPRAKSLAATPGTTG